MEDLHDKHDDDDDDDDDDVLERLCKSSIAISFVATWPFLFAAVLMWKLGWWSALVAFMERPAITSRWQLALRPGLEGFLCVTMLGVDRPCEQKVAKAGMCIMRKQVKYAARAACRADPECTGVVVNLERTAATLKYKQEWVDPAVAAAHGWHTARGANLTASLSPLLAECQASVLVCGRR